MGTTPAPQPADVLVQLVLRGQRRDELIQSEEDWRSLGLIASRMLFWSGGAIYACRCEGSEMRFAIRVVHASIGTIAHQLAGAYATHLRKTRGLRGAAFKHYAVIALRDGFCLDDLVFWLHRAPDPLDTRALAGGSVVSRVWTAESAYLRPHALAWIDTAPVLSSLSGGAPGTATYRRRKLEPLSPQVQQYFTRSAKRVFPEQSDEHTKREPRPNIETIARSVAAYCKVSYEDMLGATRKRGVSRARVIATVLAARNGATAAAAARLFNRSRSTLIEQVEHYRATQPEIFAAVESLLESSLVKARE